jgi:hypothetical protein
MAWSAPRTWVTAELVTAALMNTHVRDQYLAVGEWAPGDLKITYRTHANATTTTLTEPESGWFISNGATFTAATYPLLNTEIGTNVTPDFRGRSFRAPGTQGGRTYSKTNVGGAPTTTLVLANLANHGHGGGVHSHPHTLQFPIGNVAGGGGNAHNDNNLQYYGGLAGGISNSAATITAEGSGSAFDRESPYHVGGMVLIKHD